MSTIKIKINHGIAGYNPGDTVDIDVKADGSPVLRYWRRRLKDSQRDNCIEIVEQKSKTTTPAKRADTIKRSK